MTSKRRKARRAAQREAARISATAILPSTTGRNTKKDMGNPPPISASKSHADPPQRANIRKYFLGKILPAVGGAAAFALWILSVTTNGFFNFFSSQPAVQLFPFALVLCGMIVFVLYKLIGGYRNHKAAYWVGALVAVGILVITFRLVSTRTRENQRTDIDRQYEHEVITNIPGQFEGIRKDMSSLQKNGYIKGTLVTHDNLEKAFPFGYIVLSERDGKWTYEPHPSGRMEWDFNWDKTRVAADYSKRQIHWIFTEFSASLVLNGRRVTLMRNNVVDKTTPMEINIAWVLFFQYLDQPMPFGAIIGDNQKDPVFVIGFRIPYSEPGTEMIGFDILKK